MELQQLGERRAGGGGGRRRELQLAEHAAALQLLHRLAKEGVQAQGAQELHRIPAHSQRKNELICGLLD